VSNNDGSLVSTKETLLPDFKTTCKLPWAYTKYTVYYSIFYIRSVFRWENWEEISKPTSLWLEERGLNIIKEILLFAQTGQGYGFLDELPAYYILIWLRPLTIFANLNPFINDTKIIPSGYQTLWEVMLQQPGITTFYETEVQSVNRETGEITIDGTVKNYDAVILAAPVFENKNLVKFTSEELEVIDNLYWDTKFTSMLFQVDEIKNVPLDSCRIYIRDTYLKDVPIKQQHIVLIVCIFIQINLMWQHIFIPQ
jgi:hypothetical protein